MENKNKKCIIDTAVIPIAGLGTRFLPLSKIIPKELFPLGSKPILQYVVEEAIEAGIKKIIFVISPKKIDIFKKYILNYFKEDRELTSILKERKKEEALYELKCIPRIKYEYVVQRKPKGDGDAILRTEKLVGKKPFLVLFGDDISLPYFLKEKRGKKITKECMASELMRAYKKFGSSILCLYKMKPEDLRHHGVPDVKKLKNNFYKIKDIIEKPEKKEMFSDFALIGKYILVPEIFYYLKNINKHRGEIILTNAIKAMIKDGRNFFGIETRNKWIQCGTKEKWIENFRYFTK